jgi:hypothetical protein
MQVEFEPERIAIQIALARKQAGVKVGEELTAQVILWPQVETSGRVISFGQLVEEAVQEAVEVAEAREAGG